MSELKEYCQPNSSWALSKKRAYPWQPARPSDILSLFTFQDNLKELKDYYPHLNDVICTVCEQGVA